MARIAWYLAKKRRVDEGDDTDAHHYTAACYADAFVSGDSRLGQICDLIPDARARPLTLQQFATTYLGWD